MKTNILALSALLLTSLPAVAEQITITLDTPTVNAQPGQTVQLTAQLVNNSGFTIDLNGIVLNMFGQFTVDTNPFFTGPATIGPNQTLQLFPLANITVADPFTDPLGILPGDDYAPRRCRGSRWLRSVFAGHPRPIHCCLQRGCRRGAGAGLLGPVPRRCHRYPAGPPQTHGCSLDAPACVVPGSAPG